MTPTTSIILVGLFALISLPLEIKALDLTECADDYGIAETDSMEVIQQKMMTFFGANCPLSGPVSGTPECCFITPPLTRITADAAFDAIQKQSIDGNDGVIMIDVRTSEEVYWVGQPAQVNEITLSNGKTIIPVDYKGTLNTNDIKRPKIELVKGKPIDINKIESVDLSPIAFNIPVEFRDTDTDEKTLNDQFGSSIVSLFASQFGEDTQGKAAIFFCRSGKRSTVGCYIHYCKELLQVAGSGITFYEIEAYDSKTNSEINGNGGFEGSTYDNAFLGYRGFPGRMKTSPDGAVDFKDTGLPIIIGMTPQTLDSNADMNPPYKCFEDPSYPRCNLFF